MSGAADIRLVLMDIDGTIVDTPDRAEVTPELAQTVRAVAQRGVKIGLATGRNYGHMMSQMRPIGFTGPFICNGGAYVVKDGTCCFESLLPLAVVDAAWEQTLRHQCYIEFSGRDVMHTYIAPAYTGLTFPRVGTDNYLHEMCPEEFDAVRTAHISKITIVVDSREKAEQLGRFWSEGPLAGEITLSRSFWYALEITNPGITKGASLPLAAASAGCTPQQVMVIGDGDNDAEILRAAGVSFAMANASPAAAAAAKYRAPSVKEDGACAVLRRYILAGAPLSAAETGRDL